MKITLDRTVCSHHPAGCEDCFGDFLRQGGIPDRPCLVDVQDDGQTAVTVIIRLGAQQAELIITEANREEIIYQGWMKFVNLPPCSQPAKLALDACASDPA